MQHTTLENECACLLARVAQVVVLTNNHLPRKRAYMLIFDSSLLSPTDSTWTPLDSSGLRWSPGGV